jgi:hypothetical protein
MRPLRGGNRRDPFRRGLARRFRLNQGPNAVLVRSQVPIAQTLEASDGGRSRFVNRRAPIPNGRAGRSLHGREKRRVVSVPPRPPPLEVGVANPRLAMAMGLASAIRLRLGLWLWFGRDRARKPVEQPAMRSRNQQQSRHRRSGAGAQQNRDLIRQWRHQPPIYAGFSEASKRKQQSSGNSWQLNGTV